MHFGRKGLKLPRVERMVAVFKDLGGGVGEGGLEMSKKIIHIPFEMTLLILILLYALILSDSKISRNENTN